MRRRELDRAAEIIGYDEVVLLGYRDSGMPGHEANSDPRSFAARPLEETVGRLVAEIRRVRPQVIITYGEDQQYYPHPDHLRVHEISVAAFDAAGRPDAFPDAGRAVPAAEDVLLGLVRARGSSATHAKFLELGLESPLRRAAGSTRPSDDDRITTSIDLTGFEDVRRLALLAHATQVDPTSKYWFGPSTRGAEGRSTPTTTTSWRRAASRPSSPEEDLFAGVRLPTSR